MKIQQNRLKHVSEKLVERGLDGALVFSSPNLHYLSGFHTFPGERLLLGVVPVNEQPFFFAPQLYGSHIKEATWFEEIILWSDQVNPYEKFQQVMSDKGLDQGRFAVDDTMWASQLLEIQATLPGLDFVPFGGLVNNIRLLKTSDEIAKLEKAGSIVDQVFEIVLKSVKTGMTEMEIAAMMEFEMKKLGAARPAFPTIVGSGPNSAIPHHNTSERKVQLGEFLLLDFGAVYQGYCSDTTRTICLGQPTSKMQEIYHIVEAAQEIGVQAVKPGIKASEVDIAVRNYISGHGYGDYFTHRTGHGIGLEGHEEPYITLNSDTVLKPGMAFSIEPGIYIEGDFGVRIEDIVVVTEHGCKRMNNSSRSIQKIF